MANSTVAAPQFTLAYDSFEPAEEGLREALTSTGNGYFCTRGVAEWEDADDVHYPGTYAHGGYNRETTMMGGHPVLNEDLVNLPNWLVLKLRIEGEEPIGLGNVEVLSYRHELDIRNAVVSRTLRFRDRAGRETTLRSRRFVSMGRMHQGALEWTITPENWSGCVEVVTALDGRVTNRGVARYRQLEGHHLDPVSPRTFGPEVIALKCRTRQSELYVSEAARTQVFQNGQKIDVDRDLYQTGDYIQQVLSFDVEAGADPGSRSWSPSTPRATGRSASPWAARGGACCATRPSTRRWKAMRWPGTSSGGDATSACPTRSGRSSSCASTSHTSFRCVPPHRPP